MDVPGAVTIEQDALASPVAKEPTLFPGLEVVFAEIESLDVLIDVTTVGKLIEATDPATVPVVQEPITDIVSPIRLQYPTALVTVPKPAEKVGV